jgi:hypothetical protein
MNPSEFIAGFVQGHGGLCVLDKIHLPYASADSGPAGKFGLGAEFLLPDDDRALLRDRALRFMSDYWQTFPTKVNEFLPDGKRRTVKLKGDPTTAVLADYLRIPVEDGYGTLLLGESDIGLPNDDVPPYQAHVLVRYPEQRMLSFVSTTFPACGDGNAPNFQVLLSAVLRWCDICQPVHGCAGFTLIFAPSMKQNSTLALSMMKRFPGFDFQDGGRFSRNAEQVHDRIKCVNWLTVLSDPLVNELGGVGAVREALAPLCAVHEYDGGIVIQAGAFPMLGDTQRGDVPQAYQLVARYTKAVRFESGDSALFRVPDGMDNREETLAWIRRFD